MNISLSEHRFLNWWSRQNKKSLVRGLVILIVLLSCIVVVPKIASGDRNYLFLFLAYLGVGSAVILLKWPTLGLLAIIPVSLIVPFSIGTGTQTSINAAVILVGLLLVIWLLDVIIVKHKFYLRSHPIKIIILFLIASIISFGFGQINWFPIQSAPMRAQLGGILIFFLSAGAFFLTAHQANSQSLKWMTFSFLLLGGLYISGRLVPQIGELISKAKFFDSGSTGSLFWTWLVAMAFSQALFNSSLAVRWRVLCGILLFATFVVSIGYVRDWTSGWLPSVIAIAVILLVARPRLGLIILFIAGLILLINLQFSENLVLQGNQYSISTRMEAWTILINIIKLNPVFGLGFANYYYYTALFPINSYYVPFNSHNNYVDLIAQTGLVGTACFLWFFWSVWRVGWKLRKIVPAGFAQAYVYGALGGLVGTLVAASLGDWALPFVYNIGLSGFRASLLAWLFLGGLVAFEQSQATHSAN